MAIAHDFSFGAPDSYPNAEWSEQSERYDLLYSYYTGEVLEETVKSGKTGTQPKYPIRINLARTVAHLLAFSMLGHWDDHVLEWAVEGENAEDPNDYIGWVNKIGRVSRFESTYVRQTITSSFLGGQVWGIKLRPDTPEGLMWFALPPEYFFPVYSMVDNELLEVHVSRLMSAKEAELLFNVKTNRHSVVYTEMWNKVKYEVTVDDTVITAGATPGGVIPYVYIPRMSPTGDRYGISGIEDIMGIQDELNGRLTDMGDAINKESHRKLFFRNIPAGVKSLDRRDEWVDLGTNFGAEPDILDPSRAAVPAGTLDTLDVLINYARSAANTPAIAFGEDEGSQRSGETLVMRMWPMLMAGRVNRVFVADGLSQLVRKTLDIALAKDLKSVKSGWVERVVVPLFPPMLPKERSETINEVVQLRGVDLLSDERALELLGVSDADSSEELKRLEAIKAEQRAIEEQRNNAKLAGGAAGSGPNGGRTSKPNKPANSGGGGGKPK